MSFRGYPRSPWLVLALSLSLTEAATAQDAPPLGWTDVSEVTLVMTSGNATARTFGIKNTAAYRWPGGAWQIDFAAVRAESGVTTRVATGTPANFTVTEETETETTAENYLARTRYDRSVGSSAFLLAGVGWERNTFAGIENRYTTVAGAGRSWFDSEERRFKSDLGLTYTVQDDVVEDPTRNDGFLGVRMTSDYFRAVTTTTRFTSVLVVDENLDETDDLRADWSNSLAVAISTNLALKVSYQILFDNLPALTDVPLGAATVQVPLDKVDGMFTVAVVVNF